MHREQLGLDWSWDWSSLNFVNCAKDGTRLNAVAIFNVQVMDLTNSVFFRVSSKNASGGNAVFD